MALRATKPEPAKTDFLSKLSCSGLFSLGALLAIGIIVSGFLISSAMIRWQESNRYVTVKGLAEREVNSDLAIWSLRFNATGNDLGLANQKISSDRTAILRFLTEAGFKSDEIEQGQLKVTDLLAREYRAEGSNDNRYIVESSFTLRTPNVEAARRTAQNVGQLVQSGIVLMDNRGPIYRFTGLNEIKPQLIAEATKNARASAEQFARDSGSEVGAIRAANQGTISLTERDGMPQTDAEYGGAPTESGIIKKVRVVATVDYYLK